jgi:riboflavin synthase
LFTGIIESMGKIKKIHNNRIYISCEFIEELSIGQSIAHDGICLAISNLFKDSYEVELMPETFKKSHFKNKNVGDFINLERSMKANGRFDGHIVQGHADCTAITDAINQEENSWIFRFRISKKFCDYFVNKGSVSVNGISLTIIDSETDFFTVGIIPYTWNETNLQYLQIGDLVNIETDILAKYYVNLIRKKKDKL